ncbi:hypothetical protein FSC37_16155 [Piscinibacter aquaticus]|uniref:RCC1 repeat-containing protein n=1 Tax=Piscinibacter aquaticus TaxID=392597 RepID=A0A5C6U512_9BURK|nr:hypothetical protein FSC37_16155 [Piscinibacter aquaticus]
MDAQPRGDRRRHGGRVHHARTGTGRRRGALRRGGLQRRGHRLQRTSAAHRAARPGGFTRRQDRRRTEPHLRHRPQRRAVLLGQRAGGELGDGGGVYRDVPTRVSVLGTVKAVAAGNWDTCAIDSSDALWCWGSMGDRVPVQQSAAGVRVRAVGLGADHGCYVDDAGQVFCWGNTTFGKRGDLNPPEGPNPVRRADGSLLRDAVAVAVGVNHSCAQLADGAVVGAGAPTSPSASTTRPRA